MRKHLRYLLGAFASLFVVLLALGATYLLFRDNVHTVIPNQVYRSAQLSAGELTNVVKKYHIKSIINLRGAWPSNKWYQDEMATVKKLALHHYDLRMQAYQLPKPAKLRKLVLLLQAVPRPVLIHCEGGADRTGLASAVILLLKGESLKQASQQVSYLYFAYSPRSVGRLVLPYYAKWLNQHDLRSNRQNFLEWVAQTKLGTRIDDR